VLQNGRNSGKRGYSIVDKKSTRADGFFAGHHFASIAIITFPDLSISIKRIFDEQYC
jgi:hypothetical protein